MPPQRSKYPRRAILPDDFAPDALASSASAVASLLGDVFPAIDASDTSWVVLDTDDYSIEFNIGDESPCTSVMLLVPGQESVMEAIRLLCERTGWQGFDISSANQLRAACRATISRPSSRPVRGARGAGPRISRATAAFAC